MNAQARTARTYVTTQIEAIIEASYTDFTAAFETLLGRMDTRTLGDPPTMSPEAMRAQLRSIAGPLDFVLFQKLDHGALVTSLCGRDARAVTYVFGNALIAVEMTRHDLRAGLHVPLRLMVEQVADGGLRITYDQPSSLIAPLGSPAADAIARDLDGKVERLLAAALRRARGSR
jgi:hypothetical protein